MGLGGNLHDSEQAIYLTLFQIEKFADILALSSLYETEPQDFVQQNRFQNAVVVIKTDLDPSTLLSRVLKTERVVGRIRSSDGILKGPRLIDIDILLFGTLIVDTNDLVIPHPAMKQRRFVLEPLFEILPELIDHVSGRPFERFLEMTKSQGIYSTRPLNYNAQSHERRRSTT